MRISKTKKYEVRITVPDNEFWDANPQPPVCLTGYGNLSDLCKSAMKRIRYRKIRVKRMSKLCFTVVDVAESVASRYVERNGRMRILDYDRAGHYYFVA